MDTTSKIMMRILDDLYSGNGTRLEGEYENYYESLDAEQSKTVVTDAIRKLLKENAEASCEFGETGFKLEVNG
jgi:hypothetical protein